MATYTENNVQNALADIQNGGGIATTATRHGVPRTTLRGRLSGAQSCRDAHNDEQRLSTVQEERLKRWILQQEALGYAPTHEQVWAIASGILKQGGDDKPLGKK
jgi:hypothetical protein